MNSRTSDSCRRVRATITLCEKAGPSVLDLTDYDDRRRALTERVILLRFKFWTVADGRGRGYQYEGKTVDEHHLGGLSEMVKEVIRIVEENER